MYRMSTFWVEPLPMTLNGHGGVSWLHMGIRDSFAIAGALVTGRRYRNTRWTNALVPLPSAITMACFRHFLDREHNMHHQSEEEDENRWYCPLIHSCIPLRSGCRPGRGLSLSVIIEIVFWFDPWQGPTIEPNCRISPSCGGAVHDNSYCLLDDICRTAYEKHNYCGMNKSSSSLVIISCLLLLLQV